MITCFSDALKNLSCRCCWIHLVSSCYYVSKIPFSWSNAKSKCNELGGDLFVPLNSKENSAFTKIVQQYHINNPWIGIKKGSDGEFYTTNGSKLTYTQWRKGEPNNDRGIENCGHYWGMTGDWNDIYCGFLLSFICVYRRCKLKTHF